MGKMTLAGGGSGELKKKTQREVAFSVQTSDKSLRLFCYFSQFSHLFFLQEKTLVVKKLKFVFSFFREFLARSAFFGNFWLAFAPSYSCTVHLCNTLARSDKNSQKNTQTFA
jgi:hypothetical protein